MHLESPPVQPGTLCGEIHKRQQDRGRAQELIPCGSAGASNIGEKIIAVVLKYPAHPVYSSPGKANADLIRVSDRTRIFPPQIQSTTRD